MLFVLIVIVFMYYISLAILFAIRTSGRKSAIKLIDWLNSLFEYIFFVSASGSARRMASLCARLSLLRLEYNIAPDVAIWRHQLSLYGHMDFKI